MSFMSFLLSFLSFFFPRWNATQPAKQDRGAVHKTTLEYKGRKYNVRFFGGQLLGKGGSGEVFKGEMSKWFSKTLVVAVKVVSNLVDKDSEKMFNREVARWRPLNHENVLPFYGVTDSTGVGQRALVSPLAAKGDLKSYIRDNKDVRRLQLLVQVAEGLHYLHGLPQDPIVHGDLKCRNVLIADDGRPMLCDFGLSTLIVKATGETTTKTLIRLLSTIAFAAPELLSGKAFQDVEREEDKNKLEEAEAQVTKLRSKTKATDAYAFGGMIFEAYAAEEPWAKYKSNNVFDMANVIRKELDDRQLPDRISTAEGAVQMSDELWAFCTSCWTYEFGGRPNSEKILAGLRSIPGDGVAPNQTEASAAVEASAVTEV